MKSYQSFKRNLLRDRALRKAYDAFGPEYDLIRLIIRRRMQKRMTQADLAEKIGTKQSAISRLESGRANPTLSFLRDVARALDQEIVIR